MSTEQSEASETTQQSCNPQVDITQQATSPTPTATPQRVKNPKRVAAGKAVAERTRLAREQQKKAAAEAAIIIANNKAKGSNSVADPPVSEPTPTIADETLKSTEEKNSSLTTTQWLALGSIVVSLIGIYYKREELKAVISKKKTPEPINKVDEPQPVRGVKQPRVLRHMD